MAEAVNGNGTTAALPMNGNTNKKDMSENERERDLMRTAVVKEDLHQMEARARVSQILTSAAFREELEEIIESQLKSGPHASTLIALQQISQLVLPQSSTAHSGILAAAAGTGRSAVLPIADIRGMNSSLYTKGERLMRCKLAALYRLVDMYGWTMGIFNHITTRLSQSHEHFLINAFGLLYHEVTAGSLVKVDMQGNTVDPGNTNLGVNKAGFTLHSAIHAARPDIRCIIHVHTPPAITVSIMKHGFLPLIPESVSVGDVSYHDYEGIFVNEEEKERLARNLGPVNKVMFLRHHGLVACGETVEEAFSLLTDAMRACEVQSRLAALAGSDSLVLMSEAAQEAVREKASQPREFAGKKWRRGEIEFEAHMRAMDNAGYRTGYIYRQPIIRQERREKLTSDVEYPSATSAMQYYEDVDRAKSPMRDVHDKQKAAHKTEWLNTPNVYKKEEIAEIGTTNPQKIVKWVPDTEAPARQATPIKVQNPNQFAPQGANPKEFQMKQKLIRADYYEDKIHAGPQSRIVEGSTWEEAARLKDASPTVTGEQVVVVGAASKGIIKRDHQNNALVYKSRYATNPFDNVDTTELTKYREEAEGGKKSSLPEEEEEVQPVSAAMAAESPEVEVTPAEPAPVTPSAKVTTPVHVSPSQPESPGRLSADMDNPPTGQFKRAASERYQNKPECK